MSRILIACAIVFVAQFAEGAARVYRVQNSQKLQVLGRTALDTIPQLNIVVIDDSQPAPAGAVDLGPVRMIRLKLPSSRALPRGYWGLEAINAEQAWANSPQGAGVVVAVSDTGVETANADLAPNMWRNLGEIEANGVDDDENGYVDDVFGWDFVKNVPAVKDNQYHGSHVAGTIAAANSNKISGVAPRAKIMSVSFLNGQGSGTEVNGAKTIIYAADMGAKIINCSWGGPGTSQVIEDAIAYAQARGVLVVAAAGNAGTNNDRKYFSPASSSLLNVIAVGATSNKNGNRADFSNFGQTTVELAAPGKDIKSVSPSGGYRTLSGTSMAAPHVAGVAALIWSKYPTYSWNDVRNVLLGASPAVRSWKDKSVTEGVIDAQRAVQ